MSESADALPSRPDGFEQFELLREKWNRVLTEADLVSTRSGGIHVRLACSGEGLPPATPADEIAVRRDGREIGRWRLAEVSTA